LQITHKTSPVSPRHVDVKSDCFAGIWQQVIRVVKDDSQEKRPAEEFLTSLQKVQIAQSWYHLVDKYIHQPRALSSRVRISREFISRV
jgi:hypothetical protein